MLYGGYRFSCLFENDAVLPYYKGDILRIAVPPGEYHFGFRLLNNMGESLDLKGSYRKGNNQIQPGGTYEIIPEF